MNGLVFEERQDEWLIEDGPQPVMASAEAFDSQYDRLVAEQSWSDPEAFGDVQSSFAAHVAVMAERSVSLGIVNEYSEELLKATADVDALYAQMLSYDEFYQLMCACPEDFGLSPYFVSQIFGDQHGPDDGHNHGNSHSSEHSHKSHDKEKKKEKKKKKAQTGWLALYLKSTSSKTKAK
jgi:hypothetical protein